MVIEYLDPDMSVLGHGIGPCYEDEQAKDLSIQRPGPDSWVIKHIPSHNFRCGDSSHYKNQKTGRPPYLLCDSVN